MLVNVDLLYGHIQMHTTEWREGDDLVMGGWSSQHDRSGKETSRTQNVEHVRLVGYYAAHKPSWLERLFGI